MEFKVIGSSLCGDTKKALKALDELRVSYEFLDILTSLDALKAFLKEMDTDQLFEKVQAKGIIGIPLFIFPDGTNTLSLHKVLEAAKD